MHALPPRVLFGAAYYHEYQPDPRLATDLDLMQQAHFSVIRVGESTWSTWEPEDGRFELDWMRPVLDGAQQRGIGVVLGTPTYAVPLWLARRYPEIAGQPETGRPLGWGSRQEVDTAHAAFRFHAERVVRRIVTEFAGHPAVIGYQVDNEPGAELFRNRGVFERFKDHLRQLYGDVGALNEAWGLVYWSHRLSTWDDLWTPDNNTQPQYDLAWRAFQADLTGDFISWQAGIVRELARPDQFVTTCIAFDRPALHESRLARSLDVTAGNPYYGMQDALTVPDTPGADQGWATTGAWSVFLSADRMYAARQEPFLVTETDASTIGGPATNHPAFDGQWRQAAWAMVARGARMIEYWHWHTLHFGAETYWGGVLPHDQRPGRVYEQLAALGAELDRAGDLVCGLLPDARAGILYSVPSKWGLAFQPPVVRQQASHPHWQRDERAYSRLVEAFYRGAFAAGVPVRLVHDSQLVTGDGVQRRSPAEVAAELPVLVVPGLYIASDSLLDWLAAYARSGGHLVLGVRTAYADQEARARTDVKPSRLSDTARVRYQEFSNIQSPVPVRSADPRWTLSADAHAVDWIDCLIPEGAEIVAEYVHPHFGAWPALVTTQAGAGRITTVGTIPDGALARDIFAHLVPPPPDPWLDRPASVTVSSATAADGQRVHVVHNWSWESARVTVPTTLHDVLAPGSFRPGDTVALGAWDVRVLVEQHVDPRPAA